MGLIKAATGAAGGTLADQWKECDYERIRNCRGGRAVYDDRGSREDCGSMCGTGRIHI